MIVNAANPKTWTIKHPAGHIYVLTDLDGFLRVHQRTKAELERHGWKFQSRTVKLKPMQ